jgi:hypothetical protein
MVKSPLLDQWRRRCNGSRQNKASTEFIYIKCGGTGWINGEEDVMVPSLLSRQNAPLVLGSTGDG